MNIQEVPAALRKLADQVESANLTGVYCEFQLRTHGVTTREDLAKWARLMGDGVRVQAGENCSWVERMHWRSPDGIGYVVFFTPGLLGGSSVVIKDSDAGLASLLGAEKAGAP